VSICKMYYPIAFEKDVLQKPMSVKLMKKDYVLWHSAKKGVVCMPNRCPHRGAKLSDGRVVAGARLECPYHGWQFNQAGGCMKIPQLNAATKIPMACDIQPVSTHIRDGIVWISENNGLFQNNTAKYARDPKHFVSDYYLEAPYNYYLQIENLLDPAHLHFIHDGFQGNRDQASEITLKDFRETEYEIYGYFEHVNDETPDIAIQFIKPFVVDVSIYDKKTKTLTRKNIIYTSPIGAQSCNVLFRDVAFKETILPKDDGFLRFHSRLLLNRPFVEEHYQFINQQIIKGIMDQDIEILKRQQENIDDYRNAKYVMPAVCDRLIIAFRHWVIKGSGMADGHA